MGLRGPKAKPVAERFESKVSQKPNGCIEWTAGTNGLGYGVFHPNTTGDNKKEYAHRWAYEQKYGEIPEGLHLDHLCRNPSCVNPEHLEPVTPRVNILRGISDPALNAKKTSCHKGHQLTPANVYVNPGTGYRNCRECNRIRDRKRKRKGSSE